MSQPELAAAPGADGATVARVRDIEAAAVRRRASPVLPTPHVIPSDRLTPTPAARLARADASPTPFPTQPIPAHELLADTDADAHGHDATEETVLYLAYGSNMCAATFQGRRGIRPLSKVNVAAPSLRLVFDLPGLPYIEPCFANTALRKVPHPPPFDPPQTPPGVPDLPDLPDPSKPRPRPPQQPLVSLSPEENTATERERELDEEEDDKVDLEQQQQQYPGDPVWNSGLIGVVYEVTKADYAHIVATEGGGASYHDILVPCFPLDPQPPGVLPKPFLAHTLFAPSLPSSPPDDSDSNNNDRPRRRLPQWVARLLRPARRPRPDYAQPSARYLGLLRDGAREHGLPRAYQAYLAALRPYRPTTVRQRLGAAALLLVFSPLLLLGAVLGPLLSDERGRAPRWLAVAMNAGMNLVWLSYDAVVKRVFGDGERTIEDGGEPGTLGWTGGRRRRPWWRRSAAAAAAAGGDEEARGGEKRCFV